MARPAAVRQGPTGEVAALTEARPAVQVRPASPSDFEAVAALLAELGRPALTAQSAEAARQVYARHVAGPATASLVAEVGGVIVGFLSLEFRERLNRVRPQAWIPDLIVTGAQRGRGAGKALLQRAIALAAERGCWSVTLESGHSRHVAHRLYRAVGLADQGVSFLRQL